MHKISALLMAAALSVGTATATAGGDGKRGGHDRHKHKAKDFELTILHINDHHSHLAAETIDFDVSGLGLANNDGDPLDEVEINYGGFPMLKSLFDRQERSLQRKRQNYLKIHAGDAVTGTLFYTLFDGKADAVMMNQICFDAFALGNHEFDDGDSGLASFLTDLDDGHCDTSVLAANVRPAETSALAEGFIQPFTIRRFGAHKVGLIGIDIAQKTKVSSSPDEGTQFLDEATTSQFFIDMLRYKFGVNKVVLVTHFQYEQDIALAEKLYGVDVIIGGDSHTLLGSENFNTAFGISPSGPYPTETTDALGNKVCIAQAWEYAHLMGRLNVTFDREGNVKSCSGKPLMPVERGAYFYELNDVEYMLEGSDKRAVNAALRAIPEVKLVRPDGQTTALLATFEDQIETLTQEVIGSVTQDLCLERFPGQGRGAPLCTAEQTSVNGSDISNIVAKAFMTVTPTADVAIQNGGGVRVSQPAGDFTIGDAFTLLPFSNTLVTLELTGAQIKQVLEEALANPLDNGGSTGSYPYASGLRYDINASAAFGARVTNLEVNPRVSGAWQPISMTTVYTVVTNSFIAAGRDGYLTFATVPAIDTFTEYGQAFVDFVEGLNGQPLEKLPVSEYSTQNYVGRDGCAHTTPTACAGY